MRILNIQRMSTEDGPGLRTTVFFKGCPLQCQWCHNPESISPAIQKEWISIRCIGCGTCVGVCPQHAITLTADGIVIDESRCTLCLRCVSACPTGAMQQIGKQITPEALAKELGKDRAYFNGSGGVTLSGGEVMAQSAEVLVLCRLLKQAGISIALDTAGFTPYANFESLLPFIDLILYDLKLDDREAHQKHCGVDNTLIKANLVRLSQAKVSLWIRTPIIPGATDDVQNIRAIAQFLFDNAIQYERWELCAFNNLCKDKYHRLHQTWDYENAGLITPENLQALVTIAQNITGETAKITGTGLTRLKEATPCTQR